MNPENEWELIRKDGVSRFAETGMSAVRVALLFGSAAIALALMVMPFVESQSRSPITQSADALGLDTISTGSIGYKGTYTIRKSVLQSSPDSICLIRDNGTRTGDC